MRPPGNERAERGSPAPRYLPNDALDSTPTRGKLDDAARAKAAVARAARIAAGAKYRRQWLDSGNWEELARKRGIRLPQGHTAPTPQALKKWHESLGNVPFSAVYGCRPSRLIALNPSVPLRAFVGVMLELGGRR